MGIYLNPGNENFRRILSADIYVDKTMMLEVLNRFIDKGNNYVCISRPRRFGKTIAGNMLSAYYSRGCDSTELFRGLKIASVEGFDRKLNQYNVIKVDLNSELQNTRDLNRLMDRITDKIKVEMKEAFPSVSIQESDSLAESILKVYAGTGETFILIFDEYDVMVREQVSSDLFDLYLRFLNGLFKSDTLRPAISLAYLTGILPIVRDKIQSKLNNFREYTIVDAGELAEFVGFTGEEVKELCRQYHMDFKECSSWYNGYHQYGYDIYNPESLIMSMEKRVYDGYWGKTSSYQVITDRLRVENAGLRDEVVRMLAGEAADVDIGMYLNTMEDFRGKNEIYTYLIHLGYLAYDSKAKKCYIPNREIRQEWLRAIHYEREYQKTNEIIQASNTTIRSFR